MLKSNTISRRIKTAVFAGLFSIMGMSFAAQTQGIHPKSEYILKNTSRNNMLFTITNRSGQLNCLQPLNPNLVKKDHFMMTPGQTETFEFNKDCMDDFYSLPKDKRDADRVAEDMDYIQVRGYSSGGDQTPKVEELYAAFRFSPQIDQVNGISFAELYALGNLGWSWKGQTNNYIPLTLCNTDQMKSNGGLCPEE